MRWVSCSIRDALLNGAPIACEVHPVAIVHPDKGMEVDVAFLDEADHRVFAEYAASRTSDENETYPVVSLLRRTLPASSIVLVFNDRERRKLNDRVFILKVTSQLGSICAHCLRDALRAAGRPSDLDLRIPRLSGSYNISLSPSVMRWLLGP